MKKQRVCLWYAYIISYIIYLQLKIRGAKIRIRLVPNAGRRIALRQTLTAVSARGLATTDKHRMHKLHWGTYGRRQINCTIQ